MIRFALVGCGRIAEKHVQQINREGVLAAVCDVDSLKAEKRANGAAIYTSINDLLQQQKEVDVVVICTPNGLHAEHIIKSLQAGKHVLCEKPMCLTAAAAWQIIETEKFTRKKLFVVKSARYNPLLQQIKAWIEAGALGKIYSFGLGCFWHRPNEYYTDWHGRAFPDGGTLYTQFSHYVDALVWLFGDVQEAKGFSANAAHGSSIEFEDTGAVALLMEQQVIGTLNWSVNTFNRNAEISLTIIAEKGTIALSGEYLNEIKYAQLHSSLTWPEAALRTCAAGNKGRHEQVYQDFVGVVNKEKDGNALEGLRTVTAIEKIYKSLPSTLFLTR